MTKKIKAHRGMAHVPKQVNRNPEDRFSGKRKPPIGSQIGQPLVQVAPKINSRLGMLPLRKQPRMIKKPRTMREPMTVQPPRPIVRPITQSDAGGGRNIGTRPIKELPNKGRRIIQRPPDSVVQVSPMPTVSQPQPKMDSRARRRQNNKYNSMADEFLKNYNQPKIQYKKGGYVSRAKYGSTNNIKK